MFTPVGFLVWTFGFGIEVAADHQMSRFIANPEYKVKFIHTSLWSRSRHPNYFGEFALWIGIMVITLPVLQGWQWVALIFPVFVILQITRVSGIPLLDKKAEHKWGDQADYESHKKTMPLLTPRL